MRRILFAAALIGLTAIAPVHADQRSDDALRASRSAIGTMLPDFAFVDTANKPIRLSQFRGKPLLVNLIYTSCADVCPAVIESLAPAAVAGEETLGPGSFNIITVGFDTRHDTPERMRSFARAHAAGGGNWYFLASDSETMNRLISAVGFGYSASAGGFDHMAQITVIDKEGKIYDQVYGGTFAPPAIVEPLKQLILGGERSVFSLAGLSDRVKLFCTVYDPRTGRYYFDYSIFVSFAIGAICLGGVLYFLIRETRKSLKAGGS
jgi:protein SCO1/2